MEEIKKPAILKLKETEEGIVKIINSSELPAFVLKMSVEKILRQIEILEQQELSNELEIYNKAIKDKKKESDK